MNSDRIVEQYPDSPWAKGLAAAFPKFSEGLARVGDLLGADGALSARDKKLCLAAVAAVKLDQGATSAALGASFAEGLSAAEAWGAAINVLLSRGIPAFETLVTAIEEHHPGAAPSGEPFTEEVTTENILGYYTELFGTVPPNVTYGSEHAPGAVHGYYLMRQAALEESPLDPMLADLVLVAVNASEYMADYAEIHARFALRGGATAGQLAEAAACAIPSAGVAAWLAGATACIAALENP